MKPRSVTVFVRRIGGQFHANTHHAEAIDVGTATQAARKCAARHFNVGPTMIDLMPDDEHVIIATVKPDREDPPSMLWPCAACALVGTVALAVVLWKGGAL